MDKDTKCLFSVGPMDLTVIWFFFLLQYIDVNFAPHISIAYSLMPHTLCKGPVHVPLKSRISIKCHLKYTKLVYLLLHLFNHKDILHNQRYHRYLGMCTISLRLDRTASTIAKTIFVIEFRIRLRYIYIYICIYIYEFHLGFLYLPSNSDESSTFLRM